MVTALPKLDYPSRTHLEAALLARRQALLTDPASIGWPAWNLARERAREALRTLP